MKAVYAKISLVFLQFFISNSQLIEPNPSPHRSHLNRIVIQFNNTVSSGPVRTFFTTVLLWINQINHYIIATDGNLIGAWILTFYKRLTIIWQFLRLWFFTETLNIPIIHPIFPRRSLQKANRTGNVGRSVTCQRRLFVFVWTNSVVSCQ